MIVEIDESSSFAPACMDRPFFAAVHLRQRKTLYDVKQRKFVD